MLIAELLIDHPFLRQPLNEVPDIVLEWEVTVEQPDGSTQMIFWANEGDFDAFDEAIKADATTTETTVQADFGDRRLYRTDHTPIAEMNLVPKIVDLGGVLQEAIGTAEGWRCRVRFPDREAFRELHSVTNEYEIAMETLNLYQQTSSGDAPFLTNAQRETLLTAVECGYLQIPREASLEELGEELGITQSAASERFRRGVRELIKETIPPESSQE